MMWGTITPSALRKSYHFPRSEDPKDKSGIKCSHIFTTPVNKQRPKHGVFSIRSWVKNQNRTMTNRRMTHTKYKKLFATHWAHQATSCLPGFFIGSLSLLAAWQPPIWLSDCSMSSLDLLLAIPILWKYIYYVTYHCILIIYFISVTSFVLIRGASKVSVLCSKPCCLPLGSWKFLWSLSLHLLQVPQYLLVCPVYWL